jgi:hypothetical protein
MVQPRAQREIEERAMPFFIVMTRDRQRKPSSNQTRSFGEKKLTPHTLQVSGAQRYYPGTGLLSVHTACPNPTRTGGGIPMELARTRSSSLFLVLVLVLVLIH